MTPKVVYEEHAWLDKSEWGDGPWQHEPDRVEWRDGEFVGLALRNERMGSWCAYLGVPPGHPWHGNESLDVDVHGGVTFADRCMDDPRPQRERVCHVPQPGESDDVWWIGFDCAHFSDYPPLLASEERRLVPDYGPPHRVYRTLDYVREEVASLARQARA